MYNLPYDKEDLAFLFQVSDPILEIEAKKDINGLYDSLKAVDVTDGYLNEFARISTIKNLELKHFFDENEPFAVACLEKTLDDNTLELQFSERNDLSEQKYYIGKYRIVRSSSDEIMGFSGLIKNISVDQYFERKLKNLSEQLNRKIRDLQNINFATSHRIRSPLARILGLIEILKMEGKYDPYMAMLEDCSKELDEEIRLFSERLQENKNLPNDDSAG